MNQLIRNNINYVVPNGERPSVLRRIPILDLVSNITNATLSATSINEVALLTQAELRGEGPKVLVINQYGGISIENLTGATSGQLVFEAF
jgi:hypothetical protein